MTRTHRYRFLLLLMCMVWHVLPVKAQENTAVARRVIVIGDAGRLLNGKSLVADAVAAHVAKNDNRTTIVFAGDNVYAYGLPGEEDKNYAAGTDILNKQLQPFAGFGAQVYMLPGNHDWQKSGPLGWERIKREAAFVNGMGLLNVHFLPQGGCPGPEEIPVGDSVLLIIMDTQWWLQPYEKPGTESDCACKTRDEVIAKLHDIAWRNRNKKIVFVSHQPFRSHGVHGGYYTWKQHIFPFTDMSRNAYIPLPVIGSIYPVVRGGFGNVQDLHHPEYRQMVKLMEQALSVAPDVIFAAGHDHNLQLMRDNGRSYIVSGSGINRERVKKAGNSLFASSERGFSEIQYLANGTERILFYEVDEQAQLHLAYTYDVPAVQPAPALVLPPAVQMTADSITVSVAADYNRVGSVHRLLLGNNYRKTWATPVRLKIFYLSKEKGGLTILQKGGGKQTKSLRMKDATGKEWVLRTIQKDPELALPEGLRATVAKDVVQDQISAANPYAPLTVPVLADALGVPHANPQIVYVPDDTALGIYRGDFAGSVCVFEEREPGAGDKDKTYSTTKVLEKLEADNDVQIDEKAVLRARMLDLLIADWDRHEDQWRWGKREEQGGDVYYPIPRDRDQVYFVNTGLIPAIVARKWLQPKFQGFKNYIRDVNGAMFNGRYFDRYFLTKLREQEWKEVIADVQAKVTDDVIKAAVRQLPDTVYRQLGRNIEKTLITRRGILMQEGLKYYRFLAKAVNIVGSDKRELFIMDHGKNGVVDVSVRKLKKDGEAGKTIYRRSFDPGSTKELRLYGRGGKDVFAITGTYRSPIRIRMIGGGGADSFYVDRGLHNKAKLLVYDRSDKDNRYPSAGLVSLRTSAKETVNEYNGRSFKYDILMPQATAGYNLDDGILLGAGLQYTRQGFRRDPFASRHRLLIGHALATNATFIRYTGDFKKLVGNNDLHVSVNVKAPDNTSNFFGVGNETAFLKTGDKPIRYYRTRYNLMQAHFDLQHPLSSKVKLFAGISGQYYNMSRDDNEGRYIYVYQAQHPDENLFTHKYFGGLSAGYEIDRRNNELIPTRGFYWRSTLSGMQQFGSEHDTYGQLVTDMRFFMSFHADPRVVIANHIGAGVLMGDPEFYQMLYIGGKENLAGFRAGRFAGKAMLYHNIELRVKLFDFTSYLFPGAVGLTGFNDIGRVWIKDERSRKWHESFGGGLYVTPAKLLLVNAFVAFSEEGTYPYINIGYRF
jgi:hypothetical protein